MTKIRSVYQNPSLVKHTSGVVTDQNIKDILFLYSKGISAPKISQKLKISLTTVYKYLHENKVKVIRGRRPKSAALKPEQEDLILGKFTETSVTAIGQTSSISEVLSEIRGLKIQLEQAKRKLLEHVERL